MQQYIGTKIIKAGPGAAPELMGRWEKGTPGMVVEYEDGYTSWSPQDVFDEAYRLTSGMPFGLAIEAMKKGNKVCRAGWNGKGMFIVYMAPLYLPPFSTSDTNRKVNDRTAKFIGEDSPLDSQGYIAMFTATKQWQPGWLASQADILSDDWMIVE